MTTAMFFRWMDDGKLFEKEVTGLGRETLIYAMRCAIEDLRKMHMRVDVLDAENRELTEAVTRLQEKGSAHVLKRQEVRRIVESILGERDTTSSSVMFEAWGQRGLRRILEVMKP